MRVHPVPAEAQRRSIRYPSHAKRSLEDAFIDWVSQQGSAGDSSLVCLPIAWLGNSFVPKENRAAVKGSWFAASKVTEQVLATLDPNLQYFSLSQADDGPYEAVPDNVLLFCAGCCRGIPIPLLYDRIPTAVSKKKAYFVSFLGNLYPPGRTEECVNERRSGRLPGVGARIRQKMKEVFSPWCASGKAIISSGTFRRDLREAHFVRVMANSIFGLAPRGYGPTSYRLYEALALGAIPVYICNKEEFILPWPDLFSWQDFCVLCPEEDLPSLPERLDSFSFAAIKRMQDAGREAAEKLCSLPWVFDQVVRTAEKIAGPRLACDLVCP